MLKLSPLFSSVTLDELQNVFGLPREVTEDLIAGINRRVLSICMNRYGWLSRATLLTKRTHYIAVYIPLDEPQTYCYMKFVQHEKHADIKLSIVTPSKWMWPFNALLSVINVDDIGVKSLIHINGQDLKCGQWQAAILYKLCGNEAEACQVIDHGLETNE